MVVKSTKDRKACACVCSGVKETPFCVAYAFLCYIRPSLKNTCIRCALPPAIALPTTVFSSS